MNFYDYTCKALAEEGLTMSDVRWIGTADHYIDFGRFKEIAKNTDNGRDFVAIDLMLVGDGWWATIKEFDDYDGWLFRRYPKKPETKLDVYTLAASAENYEANTLEEMNPTRMTGAKATFILEKLLNQYTAGCAATNPEGMQMRNALAYALDLLDHSGEL